MNKLIDIARVPSRIGTARGYAVALLWRQWQASGAYAVSLLLDCHAMAMLGIVGDKIMDVVDEAVQAKLKMSERQQAN